VWHVQERHPAVDGSKFFLRIDADYRHMTAVTLSKGAVCDYQDVGATFPQGLCNSKHRVDVPFCAKYGEHYEKRRARDQCWVRRRWSTARQSEVLRITSA